MEQAEPIAAADVGKERLLRRVLFLLAASPAAIPLLLISKYAVNVPFWDEWTPDIAGMIVKAHTGGISLSDLFAQHNEHRIAVPRLVYLLFSLTGRWNPVHEMILEWLVVVLSSLAILRLHAKTIGALTNWGLAIWFLCNILIFSPAQWENWLWGMGLANVLPFFFTILSLLVVLSRLSTGKQTIGIILLNTAATYSSAGGFVAWPITLVVLGFSESRAELRKQIGPLLSIIVAFAVIALTYFIGLRSTPGQPPPNFTNLPSIAHYVLVFLGNGFAFAFPKSPLVAGTIAGAVMLAMLLAAIVWFVHAWLRRGDFELASRMLIWSSVASFAVLSAAMAAVSRVEFGAGQALSSRYVTFSLYLPVALIQLVAIVVNHLVPRRRALRIAMSAPLVLGALLAVLSLMTLPAALSSSRNIQIARLRGKSAMLLLRYLPDMLALSDLYSSTEDVVFTAPALDAAGLLKPPLIQTRNAAAIQTSASPDPGAGEIESAAPAPNGILSISGWAILPMKHRVADSVVLTYDDASNQPIMFAIAMSHNPRDDVATRLNNPNLRPCGWTATFARARIPSEIDSPTIRAWSLDAETARMTQLAGTATLK